METNADIKVCLKNMLRWFHNFCVENNITYYALGGTLLGAMRHQGFIPWDDDIDLGVPRPDYERLKSLLKEKSGRYIFETPEDGAADYFYPYGKLYDTRTTLIENNKYKTKRGVYIDIFPIDGAGGSKEEAAGNHRRFDLKFNLLVARTNEVKKERSFIKNLIIVGMKAVPQFIINDRKLLQKVCDECAGYPYETSAYCGNLVGAYHLKEIFPKEVFGKPVLHKFEDFEIFCVEKADEYLTGIYGGWRQLPAENKRHGHHSFLSVDLNKGYLYDQNS